MEIIIIIILNLTLFWRVITLNRVVDDTIIKQPLLDRLIYYFKNKKFLQIIRVFGNTGTFCNIKHDHIFSLCIHILASLCVYWFLDSFIAACLFAAHPTSNQIACWCNGKRYGYGVIIMLFIYSYFNFIVALQLLILFNIPYILNMIHKRRLNVPEGSELIKLCPLKAVIYLKTFHYYFWNTLIPINIGMYHSYLNAFATDKEMTKYYYSFNWEFWKSLITFISVLALIITQWSNPIGFGLFWFWLFISPWCNIITITQYIGDRYAYLPNVGLMYALAHLLQIFPYGIPAFLMFYSLQTWKILPAYKDMHTYLLWHVQNQPNSPQPLAYLINHYINKMMLMSANYWVDISTKKFPKDAQINLQAAVFYSIIGKYKKAQTWLDRCKENSIPSFKKRIQEQIDIIQKKINWGLK